MEVASEFILCLCNAQIYKAFKSSTRQTIRLHIHCAGYKSNFDLCLCHTSSTKSLAVMIDLKLAILFVSVFSNSQDIQIVRIKTLSYSISPKTKFLENCRCFLFCICLYIPAIIIGHPSDSSRIPQVCIRILIHARILSSPTVIPIKLVYLLLAVCLGGLQLTTSLAR